MAPPGPGAAEAPTSPGQGGAGSAVISRYDAEAFPTYSPENGLCNGAHEELVEMHRIVTHLRQRVEELDLDAVKTKAELRKARQLNKELAEKNKKGEAELYGEASARLRAEDNRAKEVVEMQKLVHQLSQRMEALDAEAMKTKAELRKVRAQNRELVEQARLSGTGDSSAIAVAMAKASAEGEADFVVELQKRLESCQDELRAKTEALLRAEEALAQQAASRLADPGARPGDGGQASPERQRLASLEAENSKLREQLERAEAREAEFRAKIKELAMIVETSEVAVRRSVSEAQEKRARCDELERKLERSEARTSRLSEEIEAHQAVISFAKAFPHGVPQGATAPAAAAAAAAAAKGGGGGQAEANQIMSSRNSRVSRVSSAGPDAAAGAEDVSPHAADSTAVPGNPARSEGSLNSASGGEGVRPPPTLTVPAKEPMQGGPEGAAGMSTTDSPATGVAGEKGAASMSGITKAAGAAGAEGVGGEPGIAGVASASGASSALGATSAAGQPGAHGTPGSAQDAGVAGEPAVVGNPGATSAPNALGAADGRGTAGMPSEPGAIGIPGTAGVVGEPGVAGTPGAAGAPGASGAAVSGAARAAGEPGMPGATGPAVATGASGGMGATSEPGTGMPGAAGAPGATSVAGEAGAAIGAGGTGAASASGAAAVPGAPNAAGTAGSATLGATGSPGATGSVGIVGEPDASAAADATGEPNIAATPDATGVPGGSEGGGGGIAGTDTLTAAASGAAAGTNPLEKVAQVALSEAVFGLLDSNRDGLIDRGEWNQALQQHPTVSVSGEVSAEAGGATSSTAAGTAASPGGGKDEHCHIIDPQAAEILNAATVHGADAQRVAYCLEAQAALEALEARKAELEAQRPELAEEEKPMVGKWNPNGTFEIIKSKEDGGLWFVGIDEDLDEIKGKLSQTGEWWEGLLNDFEGDPIGNFRVKFMSDGVVVFQLGDAEQDEWDEEDEGTKAYMDMKFNRRRPSTTGLVETGTKLAKF